MDAEKTHWRVFCSFAFQIRTRQKYREHAKSLPQLEEIKICEHYESIKNTRMIQIGASDPLYICTRENNQAVVETIYKNSGSVEIYSYLSHSK
jgi:hypothetical protein